MGRLCSTGSNFSHLVTIDHLPCHAQLPTQKGRLSLHKSDQLSELIKAGPCLIQVQTILGQCMAHQGWTQPKTVKETVPELNIEPLNKVFPLPVANLFSTRLDQLNVDEIFRTSVNMLWPSWAWIGGFSNAPIGAFSDRHMLSKRGDCAGDCTACGGIRFCCLCPTFAKLRTTPSQDLMYVLSIAEPLSTWTFVCTRGSGTWVVEPFVP